MKNILKNLFKKLKIKFGCCCKSDCDIEVENAED